MQNQFQSTKKFWVINRLELSEDYLRRLNLILSQIIERSVMFIIRFYQRLVMPLFCLLKESIQNKV